MKEQFFESRILARRIKEFKDKHKMTYEQLGEAVNVDKSYLNRVAKMTSYMSMPVLIRLAKYMSIPLYMLFMPSEDMIREDFVENMQKQMTEKELTPDDVGDNTGLSPLRVMEILDGESPLTEEEYSLLSEFLNVPYESEYQKDNMELLETVIGNLKMKDSKKENVLKYIRDNLE